MKLRNKGRGKFVGLSSFAVVLALLATAVLCPFAGNNAEAANSATASARLRIDFVLREALASKRLKIDFFLTESGGIDYKSIAKQLGIDFYVIETINLGISGLTDADGGTVSPLTETTRTVVGSTDFQAGTNSPNGLLLTVAADTADDGAMTNKDEALSGLTTTKIALTGEEKESASKLTPNTWGFGLANTDGLSKDSLGVTVGMKNSIERRNVKGDNNFTLVFGANVNAKDLAAGEYSSKVKVTVSPDPVALSSYTDVLRQIDETIEQLCLEDAVFAAEFAEAKAQKIAEYEARMNGVVAK